MSIVTRAGDQGFSSLMYGRRVPKSDLRLEACGAVDELNAALGVARALTANDSALATRVFELQQTLVSLMGELATAQEDLPRYKQDGFAILTEQTLAALDQLAHDLEKDLKPLRGWAMPGDNPLSASFDMARTICRRAERSLCRLQETGLLHTPLHIAYLNRLSDILWLLARQAAPER